MIPLETYVVDAEPYAEMSGGADNCRSELCERDNSYRAQPPACTAHSRPPVSAGGSIIFRKYRLTYGKDLCYSSEAMEEVFFLCLKLYGGENYASEDYIGLHGMQAA